MDCFTLNFWLRILRALAAICFVGVGESAIQVITTNRLIAATSIGLACLAATLTSVPLGLLADVGMHPVRVFVVYYEPFIFGLSLAMGILGALELWFSHEVAELGFIARSTYFEVETITGLAFLIAAISLYLLVTSFYHAGCSAPDVDCDVESSASSSEKA